jgi:general secretion pathway protein D
MIPALVAALAMELAAAPAFAGPPTRTGAAAASPAAGPAAGNGQPELSGDEAGALGQNRCKKWKSGKKYTITIPRESELEQLVQWMMSISCQKFIWGAKVRSGKVTILSPEKVSLPEAYAAFYAGLETMGLTVEPAGDYFKIVESSDPKSLALPMYGSGQGAPNNDRFVTQLVRVKSANTKDIQDVVTKLKSKTGSVELVGNLLIINDRGSVVKRLRRIVRELDTFGSGEKIFFYQLQYADAEEVATILRDIFGENSAKAAPAKGKKGKKSNATFSRVIVDDRTGTLIIVASDADYQTIYRLIQQLDVRLPGGGGRIHVRKLKNADPKELATTLSQLTSGTAAAGDGKGKGKNKAATTGGVSAQLFSGEVKITADESTRSLVIVASQADYANLAGVIDELDAERKQVYIEMWLMEASAERELTAGAGAHAAFPFNVQNGQVQGQGVGLVSSAPSPDVNSLVLSPDALTGLAGGVLGPLVPGSGQLLGLGQDIPSFGVVIQAIQRLDDVNVVAEPHIYTADNQEAQLEVGSRVPTPGALSFGGGGGVQGQSLTPLQSINREDVTLDIKITPHVNDSKTVTLDVELEDRAIESTDPTLGVTTTKRRFKLDHILARDDQPVVLGGLIREREADNSNQVPGLGSIPILGWLFKRKVKIKEKRNLLVILVPHIVETPDDIRRIHLRRTEERLEFLDRYTNFKHRDLDAAVNYRKKSGLLSSVDAEARRLEQEEIIMREAEAEMYQERITGELGAAVQVADDQGGDAKAGKLKKSKAKSSKAKPKVK